ncbi:hypothetical protein TNCV_3692471 [Trichonephila clavipes]|nr:hypothetical protein TNCV_3692471 [Trichonephila clavipes]
MDAETATVLRGRAKAALTRTINFIDKNDQTFDKNDIRNKLEKLELTYTEFDKADAALPIESSEMEEFETKYYETKAKLQNILENLSVRTYVYCRTHKSRYQVPIAELAERWTELPQVSDESRSFFRVHTGYFSNIPKCIKAEFIASWACSQSSVVSSSQR